MRMAAGLVSHLALLKKLKGFKSWCQFYITSYSILIVFVVTVTVVDLCKPNPCKNGGKCTFLPEKDDYVCDCPGKFTGKDCSG